MLTSYYEDVHMSSKFVCKRCLLEASMKSNLRAHLSRKHACTVIEGGQDISCEVLLEELGIKRERKQVIECEWCKVKFASASSISHHRKRCTHKPKEDILDEYRALLQETIKVLKTSNIGVQGNHNNVGNTINNNHVYITINAHGQENRSYITEEFLTDCVNTLDIDGVCRLIQYVHLNPEHPENSNIRLKSITDKTFEKFNGTTWVFDDRGNQVISDLIRQNCLTASNHYFKNIETIFKDPFTQQRIQNAISALFPKSMEPNKRQSHVFCKIHDHVFVMFKNKKDGIMITDPVGTSDNIVEDALNGVSAPI